MNLYANTGYYSSELIADKPDLIIFETAVINNHGQSLPMDETFSEIERIVTIIKSGVPGTRIILMSPNPIIKGVEANKIGLTYNDYLNKTKEFILAKGWAYIDSYDGIEEQIKQKNVKLEDILVDGIHPKDAGYELWYNTVNQYLNTKQQKF